MQRYVLKILVTCPLTGTQIYLPCKRAIPGIPILVQGVNKNPNFKYRGIFQKWYMGVKSSKKRTGEVNSGQKGTRGVKFGKNCTNGRKNGTGRLKSATYGTEEKRVKSGKTVQGAQGGLEQKQWNRG